MRFSILATLLACAVTAGPAGAAFVISVGNGTTPGGGPTTLDVKVHSDAAGGELLGYFGLEVRITRVTGTGTLAFADPQLAAELGQANYVFHLDSQNELYGSGTFISTTTTTNDTYTGGDGTDSGAGVTVGGTDLLLAVLDLDTSAAVAGDRYQVSVVGTGGGAETTFFLDPDFTAYYDWSSSGGLLEVSGGGDANATPAPPGLLLALTGAGCLGGFGWVRRRKPAAAL